MSEYQYYEFHAIDRPLSRAQMDELRARSSRATITPARFVNVYHWGDLKGDPDEWMERYFDAFVYLANWGTRWLMLRLPRPVLASETAERYRAGDSVRSWATDEHVILSFASEEEPGDWTEDDEGEGWIAELGPLRAELKMGDHRLLYLGWLLAVQQGEVMDRDAAEPPVPPGLRALSAPLQAFARFVRLDADLLEAAAQRSPSPPEAPSRAALEGWIAALPDAEKTRLLLAAAAGEEPHPGPGLLGRFRQAQGPASPSAEGIEPRTVAALREAADACEERRLRAEAERAARERERRAREEAAARERRLDALALREDAAWAEVEALVERKQARPYDEAVALLRDLRALADRESRASVADRRIAALRERYARRGALIERLDRAGLRG